MPVPQGLGKCTVCGEYNGQVKGSDLTWDVENLDLDDELDRIEHEMMRDMIDEVYTVSCFCSGIPCHRCEVNKIHRPGSNTYIEANNSIEHWPGVSLLIPCRTCHQKEKDEQNLKVP